MSVSASTEKKSAAADRAQVRAKKRQPLAATERIAALLAHRAPGASALIVVDQLEELFTQASTEEPTSRGRVIAAPSVSWANSRSMRFFDSEA